MKKEIAQVVLGLPLDRPFDYLVRKEWRDHIEAGHRVAVPFHFRRMVGFVVDFAGHSTAGKKLKPVSSLLDNQPAVDRAALSLTKELARDYGCSWGELIATGLPAALRHRTPLQLSVPAAPVPERKTEFRLILCHDQGQSERWPYLAGRIRETLGKGQGVIFLVPTAAYTQKAVEMITAQCGESPVVLDRRLSARKELEQWILLREGRMHIAVGTRSAVFAPVRNLGLMVLYEEDHPAYKQEQSPFYHAREAALLRCRQEGIPLVAVSSAPSAELWHLMQKKRGDQEYIGFPPPRLAQVQIVDLADYKPRKKSYISFPLQGQIQKVLETNGKAVLILNRRGFSTVTRCNQCGKSLRCPRCDVNLSYIYSRKKLVCYLCQTAVDQPKLCPHCQSSYLRSFGGGVEKVESEIARLFPQARVSKCDRETAKIPEPANLIVATQAISKSLEQIKPQLIAVLDVDAFLNRFDFRAGQRTFSFLAFLRQMAQDKLVLQTRDRDSYCLKAAAGMDYTKFYRQELKFRRDSGLPPFNHLIAVGLRGGKEEAVLAQAQALYQAFREKLPAPAGLLEPQPDHQPRLRGKYRFVIMIKTKQLKKIMPSVKDTIRETRKSGIVVTVNVDP